MDFFEKGSIEEIQDLFKALYEINQTYDLDTYLEKYKQYSCIYVNHNYGIFPKHDQRVRNGHIRQTVGHLHFHIHIPDTYQSIKEDLKLNIIENN